MSIAATIAALEAQGVLVRYVPQRTLRFSARRLYLSQRMTQKLGDPNNGVIRLVGKGEIEAALTLWAAGEHIYDNGRAKAGPGFLRRLLGPPPEIWEIRVTNPTPQARIFGRFAEPDTFVATDMCTRQVLGRKGSRAWASVMLQCANDWGQILPNHAPHTGTKLSEYVTEKCDDFLI
jgi:hypothetical protein